MTSLTFVLLSGALSFGVPIAFAVYELFALPRFGRDGDGPPPREARPHAPKPLPACLLPETVLARAASHAGVLEDA